MSTLLPVGGSTAVLAQLTVEAEPVPLHHTVSPASLQHYLYLVVGQAGVQQDVLAAGRPGARGGQHSGQQQRGREEARQQHD